MRMKRRFGAVFAVVATAALVASGCSSGDDSDSGSKSDLYSEPVTLNWWHNANQEGPMRTYWQKVADDFHRLHPTVTIKVTPIETNDLQRNRLPAGGVASDANGRTEAPRRCCPTRRCDPMAAVRSSWTPHSR